jgi:hypothetical protein
MHVATAPIDLNPWGILGSFFLETQGMIVDESPTNQSKGKTLDKRTAEVGAFYWTVLAPDIVNPGREERVSIQL